MVFDYAFSDGWLQRPDTFSRATPTAGGIGLPISPNRRSKRWAILARLFSRVQIMTKSGCKLQPGRLTNLRRIGRHALLWLVLALAACGLQTDLAADTENGATPAANPTPTAPASSTAVSLQLLPAHLLYRGAFALPDGDAWSYSGHALTFYDQGDPDGASDGFPGSLYTVGHAWEQRVGEIGIPQPLITDDFSALPRAAILQPLTDITGGWLGNCTYAPGCEYREVAGLAYLPNVQKIAWNLRDWYNVGGYDQDSLGWSDLDMGGAQGVWHIGSRSDAAYHNARTSDYLFTAPEPFAEQFLGGRWLIAGNHRPAGAFGGSQGPTLFAAAPWIDGNPPVAGQELAAQALLYYPENLNCANNQFDQCAFPNYRAADRWGGGAWVESGGKTAVLIFGQKGLGANCYGTPGADCPPSLCTAYQGWQADPYEAQILFYQPSLLAEVAAGSRQPWEALPYTIFRPGETLFNPTCGVLQAVAYDVTNQLIYVTESDAGPFGATAVHVWQVDGRLGQEQSLFLPWVVGSAAPPITSSILKVEPVSRKAQ